MKPSPRHGVGSAPRSHRQGLSHRLRQHRWPVTALPGLNKPRQASLPSSFSSSPSYRRCTPLSQSWDTSTQPAHALAPACVPSAQFAPSLLPQG